MIMCLVLLLLSLLVSGMEVNNQVTLCYTNEVGCSGYAWVDLSVAGSGSNIVEELHPATAAAVRLPFEFPFKMLSFVNDAMCNTCEAGEYVSVNTSSAVRLPVYATGTGMLAFQNTLWVASPYEYGFRLSPGILGAFHGEGGGGGAGLNSTASSEGVDTSSTRYVYGVLDNSTSFVFTIENAIDLDCISLLNRSGVEAAEECLFTAQLQMSSDGERVVVMFKELPVTTLMRGVGFTSLGNNLWAVGLPDNASQILKNNASSEWFSANSSSTSLSFVVMFSLSRSEFEVNRSKVLATPVPVSYPGWPRMAMACGSFPLHVWVPSARGGAGACLPQWLASGFQVVDGLTVLIDTTNEFGPCYSNDTLICTLPLSTPTDTRARYTMLAQAGNNMRISCTGDPVFHVFGVFPWPAGFSSHPVSVQFSSLRSGSLVANFTTDSSDVVVSVTFPITTSHGRPTIIHTATSGLQRNSSFCSPPLTSLSSTKITPCTSWMWVITNLTTCADATNASMPQWSVALEYFPSSGVVAVHSLETVPQCGATMPVQVNIFSNDHWDAFVAYVVSGPTLFHAGQSLYFLPSYTCLFPCVHGTCDVSMWMCVCDLGWIGDACDQPQGTYSVVLENSSSPTNQTILFAETPFCNGAGIMSSPSASRCGCNLSYYGERCEYYFPLATMRNVIACIRLQLGAHEFFSGALLRCVCNVGYVGYPCQKRSDCVFTRDGSLMSDPAVCGSLTSLLGYNSPRNATVNPASDSTSPTFGMGEWTRTSALVAGVTIATVCVLMSLSVQCMCLGFCTCRDEELDAPMDTKQGSSATEQPLLLRVDDSLSFSPTQGCAALLPPPVPSATVGVSRQSWERDVVNLRGRQLLAVMPK